MTARKGPTTGLMSRRSWHRDIRLRVLTYLNIKFKKLPERTHDGRPHADFYSVSDETAPSGCGCICLFGKVLETSQMGGSDTAC